MARPTKCRKVCRFPQTLAFSPVDGADGLSPVIMTVDEYETIRLIDKEGLSQEQCAGFMQIARTTVQRIYESARKKLADSLVEGRPLNIQGGDFWLCNGRSGTCGRGGCHRRGDASADCPAYPDSIQRNPGESSPKAIQFNEEKE